MNSFRITASALAAALAFPLATFASDFQVVHNFNSPGGGGFTPIEDGRGIAFGLGLNGPDRQTSYLYQYDGQTYTVLHNFPGTASWLTSDGATLYGTQPYKSGGKAGASIWAWDSTRGFRVITSITDGYMGPTDLVAGPDGMLYFYVTTVDERYPLGASAFERLDLSTGTVTVLQVVSDYVTKQTAQPVSHEGRIYGSTYGGPWAYSPATGNFQKYRHPFTSWGIGFADGGLYGTVYDPDAQTSAFYRIDSANGYQVVATVGGGSYGPVSGPGNLATGTDGKLYGVFGGGSGAGTCGNLQNAGFIYQFDPVTLQQAALHDFCEDPNSDDYQPSAGLAADPDGSLYGTVWTPEGGFLYRFVP
jgi:hypothetical protein